MRKATWLALGAAALVSCMGSRAQQPRSAEARRDAPVRTAQAYEMKGTVESVGGGVFGLGEGVTIRRRDAPAVRLGVANETRIVLEGRSAKLSELREGDEVRAVFDFKDSNPIALEIEAKKP
jgi:Cu/Ag efflux protein CusF